MNFVDKTKLKLKAGDGGNGVVAFLREKHTPFGGPAGGDGGRGGSIIFIGDRNKYTLYDLKGKVVLIAKNGENGQTKNCSGQAAEDFYVKVPIGTVVIDQDTNDIIADVVEHDKHYVIAKGGKGGRGNQHFMTPGNKVPRVSENGDLGQKVNVILELKSIAQIGLVGFPNEGKSTLISVISSAKPEIADYPFTTKKPVLGVVKYKNNNSFVVADIPGIIEGASEGRGLGFQFLRHIERCEVLIHLVAMEELDNKKPYERYKIIREELKKYKNLSAKPIYIVASKMDNDNSKELLKEFKSKVKTTEKIIEYSCIDTNSIEEIKKFFNIYLDKQIAAKANGEEVHTESTESRTYTFRSKFKNELKFIKVRDGVWEVTGDEIDYLTHKIPLKNLDNQVRFNERLKKLKVEETLKKMGAKAGETLILNKVEFTID